MRQGGGSDSGGSIGSSGGSAGEVRGLILVAQLALGVAEAMIDIKSGSDIGGVKSNSVGGGGGSSRGGGNGGS